MLSELPELHQVLNRIEQAMETLSEAERLLDRWLDKQGPLSSELIRFEELAHVATHETASQLAFCLSDLYALLRRNAVRENYPQLQEAEFEQVLNQGWSLSLVQQLRQRDPSRSLAQWSALIKALAQDWAQRS